MNETFLNRIFEKHAQCGACPSTGAVGAFFSDFLGFLFPDHAAEKLTRRDVFLAKSASIRHTAETLVNAVLPGGERVVQEFFARIPAVYELLLTDIKSMYEGDPAARSVAEVVRTYPGFYAIAAYRIAHEFHRLGVPELPRTITEFAHSHTGIDIHPGAVIGDHFCIDHGTGVVIGETALVGNHVKIYQGVTLGALSVSKEDARVKRHPTIEDHVVLYAGATILGGDTVIGSHSVIGGNVWLTRSVPPHSKVYYQAKMVFVNDQESDVLVYQSGTSKSI